MKNLVTGRRLAFAALAAVLATTIALSLALDYLDVGRYLLGDRG